VEKQIMTLTKYFAVPIFLLFILITALPASPQEVVAPSITGTSVQGSEVDLNDFKGDKNVLVVFYRMHT